jgi:hypothetical protein
LSEKQVERIWIKLDDHGGEYFDAPVDGAQPVTMLMLWE